MKIKILWVVALFCPLILLGQHKKSLSSADFNDLNLDYPGLQKVKELVEGQKYDKAARALLAYYRNRTDIKHPEYNIQDKDKFRGKKLPKDVREKADKGLEHLFFVHKGYGYFDFGKDINWQYWPIKDNEIRWQLNRMYWWIPMGLAYWSTGDEKYAKEWVAQYEDWVKKNPLGLSKENDKFAWRPLEVSTRLQDQTAMFNMFILSPNFTPDFLMVFLNNYNAHASYLEKNYSEVGNHRLFEAQRMVYAGSFFPEFKDAKKWREGGIEILNTEIKKQVYQDGLQFELSPNYHTATINIFLKAYKMAQLAGLEKEFPASYKETIEKMILAQANFSFPDYTYPMFSDAKLTTRSVELKNYKEWSKVFPHNQIIKYFATEGKEGATPDYLSHALKDGGFYTFRNSWSDTATVMVLKASPPAFWHSQPDNGTFDLWVKGRNFMPDAGAYVYGGDEEIMKLRNWYKQSRVHKTLTLDNQNILIDSATVLDWYTSDSLDVLLYKNPSYKDLEHYRAVFFVDNKYFVIIDQAVGSANGLVGTHFQLAENSDARFNWDAHKVWTNYEDGNNLLIRNFNTSDAKMTKEEGKVSYAYRKEASRPAFVFEREKKGPALSQFETILFPFEGDHVPEIEGMTVIKANFANQKFQFSLNIDGKIKEINYETGRQK